MISNLEEAFKQLNEIDQDFDLNVTEKDIPTNKEKAFKDILVSFIQDLYNEAEVNLNESFTSKNNLQLHFNKHCIGKGTGKKSVSQNVLYDFVDVSQYKQYELNFNKEIIGDSKKIIITDLYDSKKVLNGFRKLFEGSTILWFTLNCGFCDSTFNQPVNMYFRSFANKATNNYGQNTIDFLIQNVRNKTVILFPLDAFRVENKFNNSIQKWNNQFKGSFKINH